MRRNSRYTVTMSSLHGGSTTRWTSSKQIMTGDHAGQGSWPSPMKRNWLEARQEIQARLYWGPCCSRGEQEQTTGSLTCWLPEGGTSLFLIWSKGRDVSRGQAGGVAWVVSHPLGDVVLRGHAQYPAFTSDPLLLLEAFQKWQLGFLVSMYLLSRIYSNSTCMQLFLVPYSFFIFCCSRRGVSRCKNCSTAAKGPRSQPVSGRFLQKNRRWAYSTSNCRTNTGLDIGLGTWVKKYYVNITYSEKVEIM